MQQAPEQSYCIVCGVDFTSASEQAVREAQRLSLRITPSVLHFVHALDEREGALVSGDSDDGAERAARRLEAYVWRVLRTAEPESLFGEQRAVFHARVEAAQSALVTVAREEQADVIVVGASERRGLSQLWHRSAVLRLMQQAPAPVLVAHERRAEADAIAGAARVANREGSGVYSAVTLGAAIPRRSVPAMDADSASSLCNLYEARASQPGLTVRSCPAETQVPQRRYGTAG